MPETKVFDISHKDLVTKASEDSKIAIDVIDNSVQAYEKAIISSVDEVISKNESAEEINVYSMVSGMQFRKVEDAKFGTHFGITPLHRTNVFDEINKRFGLEEKLASIKKEEDEKSEAAAS